MVVGERFVQFLSLYNFAHPTSVTPRACQCIVLLVNKKLTALDITRDELSYFMHYIISDDSLVPLVTRK